MRAKQFKPPNRKRPAVNITPQRKLIALLDAYSEYKVNSGEPRPSRTWIFEQGAFGFIAQMIKKFPDFKTQADEIEKHFDRLDQAERLKGQVPVLTFKRGRKTSVRSA